MLSCTLKWVRLEVLLRAERSWGRDGVSWWSILWSRQIQNPWTPETPYSRGHSFATPHLTSAKQLHKRWGLWVKSRSVWFSFLSGNWSPVFNCEDPGGSRYLYTKRYVPWGLISLLVFSEAFSSPGGEGWYFILFFFVSPTSSPVTCCCHLLIVSAASTAGSWAVSYVMGPMAPQG